MNYEPLFELEQTGIQIHYYTNLQKYNPVHWHSSLELIFILNGNAKVLINGKVYPVVPGDFVIIDSNIIHEFQYDKTSMIIVIRFSRTFMKNLIPELDDYDFWCTRATLKKEHLEAYLSICDYLKQLAPLYVLQPLGYKIKSHAIAMYIFYELFHNFAYKHGESALQKTEIPERLSEIITYIDEHHQEAISLESISEHFYLSREYFSRYFKKHLGVSFLTYVNQIRLSHIYREITTSDIGIMEASEKHGFTNYKLFNRMFKEIYGCTPREVRQEENK